MCLLLLTGCASVELPYDLGKVESRVEPRHPARVAFLPFEDHRASSGDGPDAPEFTYNGIEYEATELEKLKGNPLDRVTEAVARHLAKSRIFAQIILVLDASQAPEADLLLTGKIYRMRGYVENVEDDATEAHILSEVVITDITLEDARNRGRRLIVSDVGWSILEKRKRTEEGPTPWEVLGEALQTAVTSLVKELEAADLSGKLDVREEVALELLPTSTTAAFGQLASAPPYGWRYDSVKQKSAPIGWTGDGDCDQVTYTQRQSLRFHRALGPYRPTLHLWACPTDVALTYDAKADFPALFLGTRDHLRYFVHAVGETNWPEAKKQIAAHLGVQPPASRHIFELPAR